jgi:hypothetical protein
MMVAFGAERKSAVVRTLRVEIWSVSLHVMRPRPYPPKYIYIYISFGKKLLLAQRVQLFVAVPTMPRGTLGGAYRRTYLHLYARYRG